MDDIFKGTYLEHMKFHSFEPLMQLEGRQICSKCKQRRKFFCYECCVPMTEGTPQLTLPVDFLVVKHPKEKIGKSSIMASKALAPEHVTIHQSFDTPDFDYDSTILLFPADDSVPLNDMSKQDLEGIKTVVLIDSTWNQTKRFMAEEEF